MQYDPIKNIIGHAVHDRPQFRLILYKLLGIIFLREWYVKRAIRRLLQEFEGPIEVYDAGSGFGQYSYFTATRFPAARIRGVDLKKEQVDDCRQFFGALGLRQCEFAVEDLLTITHTSRFDFILSVDVMEHIEDDERVFRNLFRALKANGILLVNTPSNLGGSDVHEEGGASFIGEHARTGYGTEEIRGKLEKAGFAVEKISFAYGPLGSLAWRLGIKYPMMMLHMTRALFLLLPFYYLVALPIVLPLMYLDYVSENMTGTGLLVIARKR